jgi:hypothetical protein
MKRWLQVTDDEWRAPITTCFFYYFFDAAPAQRCGNGLKPCNGLRLQRLKTIPASFDAVYLFLFF